ncbi:MAG: HAD family hydrolase [Lachnospiraceae bacterium]
MKEQHKKKSITDYRAVVFDLDGTLYYQRRLRRTMVGRLFRYYAGHPWKIKELLVVKEFRSVREHWDSIGETALMVSKENKTGFLDQAQYAYVADKMKISAEQVERTVQKWIHESPLSALKKSRDEEIGHLMETLRARGVPVLIFSDYPVKEKLKALEFQADGMYSASDDRLMELKPSPKGLLLIMQDYRLEPGELLMIGDRCSRDALAAVNAGTDYLILGKTQKKRRPVYEKLWKEINGTERI